MRSRRLLLAVVLGLSLLAGCSDDGGDESLLGNGRDGGIVTRADAQRLLDSRAAAVRAGDLAEFLRSVDTADPALVARQRRYFANLRRLPLEVFRYKVLKSQWPVELRTPRWGANVLLPQVQVLTQLDGYDTVPVRRITGFAIARRGGRPVVVSEVTPAGKPFPGSSPAPWDLVRVHVRTSGGTLQLYDDATWSRADDVDRTLRRGIDSVERGLPWSWNAHVVVYVFSKKAVLDSYEGVPGGNIRHLGAMTFPIYGELGQPQVAGIRFTLLPSSLAAGHPFLDRITRHELTHVAVGDRDDGAPVWFAEGIAEYMGNRDVPQDERRIATVAVSKARAGVDELPSSGLFNGADQAWNYALAWMACDYIAADQGESTLWALMAALHADGEGTTDEQQDAVLQSVLGYDSHELARRAAKRILRIYG
ncbi:MAG: hypothetical protein J7518_03265 [Nocardioidaceae bacterium]|nr:hypothetical protein [Nocardioidaceae bacterium]